MRGIADKTAFITGGASGIATRAEAPAGPPPGFNFSEEQRAQLASLTASPEEAGELVLQGIRDNALYIFTAHEFRAGVEERFEAIRRAMGEDAAREAVALELIPGWSAARSITRRRD